MSWSTISERLWRDNDAGGEIFALLSEVYAAHSVEEYNIAGKDY